MFFYGITASHGAQIYIKSYTTTSLGGAPTPVELIDTPRLQTLEQTSLCNTESRRGHWKETVVVCVCLGEGEGGDKKSVLGV